MVNLEKSSQWLSLLANISVIAGIVFLALEIRTNTSTNRIAIVQNYSDNWMLLHAQLAENRDLATLVEKAMSGDALDPVDSLQFQRRVLQYVSQARDMLRHHDAGLISAEELKTAFNPIHPMADNARFRSALMEAGLAENQRPGGLILAEDGYDRWLDVAE